LVAVGERGIVVFSDDGGKSWRQGKVPTSESLTTVLFPTAKSGWAAGHAGIVIHTEDGGETWTRQLDGKMAAQLALEGAQAHARQNPGNEAAQHLLRDAQRLVDDGPDKPFLALCFENERSGFVAGAYGMMFGTEDGGKTWKSWMDRLDNPKGLHINAVKVAGRNVYLAGEQGLFLRSEDGGNKFTRIETPYKGSYFTLAVTSAEHLVIAGMRGNAYYSANGGKTFTKAEVPIPATIAASTATPDGTLVFVNQAGQVLASHDQGKTMQVVPMAPLPPPAAILALNNDLVLSAGWAGVVPFSIGSAGTQDSGGRP
jgi:photosystem II stability/assembly factor-like uncharacterized protein